MIQRLKQLLFQNKNTRQTVVKNIFWLSFGQIASRGIRALIIIYSARLLGTAEYGIFSYALGLAGFFTIFADVGLSSILTREVSQKPNRASQYFSTIFWIKIALLILTASTVIFIAPYFSKLEGAKLLLPLVAFLVIFDNIREFCNAFFRGKERMEREAFITLLTNVAIALFGFLILSYHKTATAITLSYISSAGLGMLAAIFILRDEFVHIVSNFKKELIPHILSSAWPIAVIGFLGAFMLNIDIIILGWMRTASDIGLYAAGQRIVQVLYTLPTILAASTFPALSRAIGKGDSAQARGIMERIMAMLFLISIPIAVGGIILGTPIMAFVFGAKYVPGALAFKILIGAIIFVFPGALIGNYILGYDRQRDVAKFVAFASLGNIILNYLLIRPFGIAGSALATTAVQSLFYVFLWQFSKKIHNFHTFRHLKKIGVATLAMGIVAFLMNLVGIHVLAIIAFSGLLYFGMLFVLKEPIIDEVLLIIRRI